MLEKRQRAVPCESMNVMDAASFMKLLASEHRLKILAALGDMNHLSVAAINAYVGLKGSALTLHLKMLREAGVIECSIAGRSRVYEVAPHYRAVLKNRKYYHQRAVDVALPAPCSTAVSRRWVDYCLPS